MLDVLNRNSGAIQALAALLTVLLAFGALISIKFQIDGADRIQREQSARDIYREYLNLAISKPELSQGNYCEIVSTPQADPYENFVEYLLYTAEQVISVDDSWRATFAENLNDHAIYICQLEDTSGYSDSVSELLESFKREKCASAIKC